MDLGSTAKPNFIQASLVSRIAAVLMNFYMLNFHVSGHIWRFSSLSSRPGFKSSSLVHWCWVTSGDSQVSAQDLDSRVHLWSPGAGSHLEILKSGLKSWIQEFIFGNAGAGSHLDILKSGL